MLDFEDIRHDLWTVLSGLDALSTVIWLNPNSPAPKRPYTTLNLTSVSAIAEDNVGFPDDNGLSAITGNREFILELQTFGLYALDRLENIRSAMQRPSIQATLKSNGIVFVDTEPIKDITELDTPQYEPRGSMDIRFRIASLDEDDVGLIETVTGTETYKDVAGETIFTAPITISVNP